MGPFRMLVERFRRWPVRIRLAIVSAALTAIILLGFAAVVGRLVSERLEQNFADELADRAAVLASNIRVDNGVDGQPQFRTSGVDLSDIGITNDAVVRIVASDGTAVYPGSSPVNLGAPDTDEVQQAGDLTVASAQIQATYGLVGPVYVEYGRNSSSLDATIDRLWIFLGSGVLIGTLLAAAAGLTVASRAMRPIAALTATAREIAATRDPSKRIPEPENDDEVAELARTLEAMLRELDAARSETEASMRRQREFVADASHELRTPLTSILANLELLEASQIATADDDELAATRSALRSSRRMSRLVSDLLLLARADAGKLGRRERCDLATIAADAFEEVQPVANGHVLAADLEGRAPIDGNGDELHRMVLNLLENAIRHTPSGTEVSMRLRSHDGRAELVVADDGPGLPAGAEDQVFERFVRGPGPADRSSTKDGTGLGLAIVQAVAVAHGGAVTAGAASGGGTRFRVDLPLAEV